MLALRVLAEAHLKSARTKYETLEDGVRWRRQEMAGILRDCRKEGIRLDMCFYDELLKLC